jgi:hypothetical protein
MCVLLFFHFPVFWLLIEALFQIARDCPEGREPVKEEDNTWGEIQDDPWAGGAALPADENEGMH